MWSWLDSVTYVYRATVALQVVGLTFMALGIWAGVHLTRLRERDAKAKLEKVETELTASATRLKASEVELEQTKAKTTEVASQLAKFTVPRRLTDEQITSLRQSLPNGPRGKVVMTFLSVERDAEKYTEQIAQVLSAAGFEVTTSKNLWLQLAFGDIFLCARDTSNAPAHAVHIQRCFQGAGLSLRAHQDPKMYSDMSVPEDAIIFVVSNRE